MRAHKTPSCTPLLVEQILHMLLSPRGKTFGEQLDYIAAETYRLMDLYPRYEYQQAMRIAFRRLAVERKRGGGSAA